MNLRASVASGWMWLLLPALLVTTALPQHAQELTIPQKLAEAGHDWRVGASDVDISGVLIRYVRRT